MNDGWMDRWVEGRKERRKEGRRGETFVGRKVKLSVDGLPPRNCTLLSLGCMISTILFSYNCQ